jgi:hypothetical protein
MYPHGSIGHSLHGCTCAAPRPTASLFKVDGDAQQFGLFAPAVVQLAKGREPQP